MKYNDKMSELLGIINSINFDRIINDLEINSLKGWINDNIDNSDPRFQEIIEKLDKILSKKVILEEDKKELVALSNYYDKLGKSFDKPSELIGIVEGIVSDNEVNLKEIVELNKWLISETQMKGIYFYDKLTLLINKVLSDGKIDNDEKNQVKILLKFLIREHDLSKRIEIIKEKVKNSENIGNQLIEIIDDNTIISKIHKEAVSQLKILLNNNCSVYVIDSEIIFLSLTLIALLNYDGNFYHYVGETYSELYEKYSEQKIEGQIRNVINKYRSESNLEHRIISIVLKNTIVPKKFLPSFFDFIYDIYRLNFDFNVEEEINLKEEFSFVYEGIKKGLNYENDELNLNVTNKTYNLIKTTKDLINDNKGINALIELSISVLKIIDNYFWSSSNLNLKNEYYEYGFSHWQEKSMNLVHQNKIKSSEFRSRWEPDYKLNNNKIYISIPNHKIKDYYNYEKLKIVIFNNDKLLYENNRPDVYEIIGGYRVESKDILIEQPIGNIRYKLVCGDEVIYDSKDKLYRDYIFFDETGYELKNNRDYDGRVILCTQLEVDGMQIMYKDKEYILEYKFIKTGDYIKLYNETFYFATVLNPGIIGKKCNSKVKFDSFERNIYSEIDGIVYETTRSINYISIVINNQRYKLSNLDFILKKRGLYNNYFIKLNFSSQEYDIKIEEIIDGKIVTQKRFYFIIDDNFNYKIEQINNEEYIVRIRYLNTVFVKRVTHDIDDINKIIIDDPPLEFILPLGIPLYKIDNSKWFRLDDLSNYIWINDINAYSNLRITGIDFDSVEVTDKIGNILCKLSPSIKENYYDLPIGMLKSYESHDFINLNMYDNERVCGLLKVYCKCFINLEETKIWYNKDDNKYHGVVVYFGVGNIILKVIDRYDNVIFESKVQSGSNFEIGNLKPFSNYKLTIINKRLGFVITQEEVLFEKNLKYYSMNQFVGKYFQIYSVDFDQTIHGVWQRKTTKLFNTYVEIIRQIDNYNFIGNLYVYKKEKKYLDKINPVEIEFVSDVDQDGEIQAFITKDGDGLFNDFENKTILNKIESKTAIDIHSYIITMERKR